VWCAPTAVAATLWQIDELGIGMQEKLRAVVVIDNAACAQWQLLAIEQARKNLDIVLILNCTNTHLKRSIVKNAVYYLINVLMMRSARVPAAFATPAITENFESEWEGAWQRFPRAVLLA
jgi:hypothetical protein